MIRVEVVGYPATHAEAGQSLLEICEDAGIPMDSACGGFACCNACRVDVLEGGAHLSEQGPEEAPFLDRDDQRLGCQALVNGPVVVRLASGM